LQTGIDARNKADISKATDAGKNIHYGSGYAYETSLGTQTDSFTVSAEVMTKASEILAQVNYNKDEFAKQLVESTNYSEELRNALVNNIDQVASLSQEISSSKDATNNLVEAYIQSGVSNEIGEDINSILSTTGNEEHLNGFIQGQLTQEIIEDLGNVEEATFEAYNEAIQNARDNFAADPEKYIQAAKMAETARVDDISAVINKNRGDNGDISSQVRSFYDNLTDEDKKLFLTLDIDDEASMSELEESYEKLRKAAHDDIEPIKATLDADVNEDE
jgi:SMC interacting uncharacterized protein involved in chromosome segregation